MSASIAGWKPAVGKEWLLIAAGSTWCGVGLLLMRWSLRWSATAGWWTSMPFLAGGLLLGMGTRYFFRKMACRNLDRIQALPEKACIFAFQSWMSYPLVIFMMALGISLRSSALPRTWLAGLYLAIGTGLFTAGLVYFSQYDPGRREDPSSNGK